MIKTIKLMLMTTFFILSACQQTPKVAQEKKSKSISEVNEILSIITIEAIKEQDYLQAQRSITALILSKENNVWEFVYSAIISLPEDMGLEIIESSLNMDTVKNSSEQLFGIAKIYISYKDNEKAMELIDQSINLDPENLPARFWRARLLTIMKQYEKADIDFKHLIKEAPENSEYAEQYASFLQETKQFEKAQALLAKQIPNPENLFRRIIFTLQAKDSEKAHELYEKLKAFEVDEQNNNRKYFLTAEAGYFLEKFEESELYYRKVLGGDNYLDAREMLSLILYEAEKFDQSKEILLQLQNAEQKYAVKAYLLESQINKVQDNPEAALETLNRSLQLLPNNPILLYDRAILNETLDNIDLMEQDLLQIIKDDPDNYEALNALGYSLADHDLKLEQAYAYIQKAISLAPDNPAIIDSLGWIQYKLGKYAEAEISFKSAMNTNMHDSELYLHLYKTLVKLNKDQEAHELLIKAKEIFPDNAKFTDLLVE